MTQEQVEYKERMESMGFSTAPVQVSLPGSAPTDIPLPLPPATTGPVATVPDFWNDKDRALRICWTLAAGGTQADLDAAAEFWKEYRRLAGK